MTDPNIREINTGIVRRFSYSLSGRSLRPRTNRGALNALRSLLIFLAKQRAPTENPALEGPVTPEASASILQRHPTVKFYLDRESASLLGQS